jgi:hypothetical protein
MEYINRCIEKRDLNSLLIEEEYVKRTIDEYIINMPHILCTFEKQKCMRALIEEKEILEYIQKAKVIIA